MSENFSRTIMFIGTLDTKMMNFFIYQIERFEIN